MSREESWSVQRVTLSVLRRVTDLGYVVSVHHLPSSLLHSVAASVETHAIKMDSDPPVQHLVRVGVDEGGNIDYRCACLLAEAVGIKLDDA